MNRREALFTTMAATLIKPINPTSISYAGACEVAAGSRLLFISGQVPERPDGSVPQDFTAQCRLTWANIERQLRDAGDLTRRSHTRRCGRSWRPLAPVSIRTLGKSLDRARAHPSVRERVPGRSAAL